MTTIADAQREMRRAYVAGMPGQLVSAALWMVSAAVGTWGSHRLAVWILVLGGFLIYPLTSLALRLAGSAGESKGNPLNALAMQVAFTVPLGLPVALTLAYFSPNRFYPAMMMLVGAHYLPFVFLYGMPQWYVLAAAMLGAGYVLGWVAPMGFATGGWIAAAAMVIYALVAWRIAATERAGAPA